MYGKQCMTNIRQIAKLAGVSARTVSRVINDDEKVAERTREHVQKIIAQTGYQPNRLAQSVATGRADTIGVIIPHTATEIFQYPIFSEMLSGIGDVLNAHGYDLLLRFSEYGDRYTELYTQKRVDGLILMSMPARSKELPKLFSLQIPHAFTCRVDESYASNWVDSDMYQGAYEAIEHLLGLGHRQIALLAGPADYMHTRFRMAGYRDAFAARGLLINEALMQESPLFDLDAAQLRHLLDQPAAPTALVLPSETTAIQAIQELTRCGLRVPDDISVVGFDSTILSRHMSPALTAIRQQGYRKGEIAAQMAIDTVAGEGDVVEFQRRELSVALIVGESSGPVPKRG